MGNCWLISGENEIDPKSAKNIKLFRLPLCLAPAILISADYGLLTLHDERYTLPQMHHPREIPIRARRSISFMRNAAIASFEQVTDIPEVDGMLVHRPHRD